MKILAYRTSVCRGDFARVEVLIGNSDKDAEWEAFTGFIEWHKAKALTMKLNEGRRKANGKTQ